MKKSRSLKGKCRLSTSGKVVNWRLSMSGKVVKWRLSMSGKVMKCRPKRYRLKMPGRMMNVFRRAVDRSIVSPQHQGSLRNGCRNRNSCHR